MNADKTPNRTEIEDFLAGLGLAQYAQAFRDNAVDLEVLPEITEQDLASLGVLMGHRKKILKAAASLATTEAAAGAGDPEGPTGSGLEAGERRQVSVLFADLAGYTELSASLDAEETLALLNRFFARADAIIESYGGRVDKHIGDAVMGLFGAPRAHTDDPERALRAAADIHAAMDDLSRDTGRRLQAHIGLASGQVVASTAGSSHHQAYTVTGDAVNLAARLDDLAKPGETLVSESLERATRHCARFRARGEATPKGFVRPVPLWAFEGWHAGKTALAETAFVGRSTELAQFRALLDLTIEKGRSHGLLLRGEPGIGKTRLLREFSRLAEAKQVAFHKVSVLDFGAGRQRDLLRSLARSLLGLTHDDRAERREGALAQARDEGLAAPGDVVFLAELLDLPLARDQQRLFEDLDEPARQEGTLRALTGLLGGLARAQARLLAVEDIHWLQAKDLGLLLRILHALADVPLLLAITTRPEGASLSQDWSGALQGVSFVTLDLQPLRPEECLAMAESLAGGDAAELAGLIARAEGNPLFLEQLMDNVSETGSADLPDSLQGLVLARIDRLDAPERAALQAASVLGQRFRPEALCHLLGLADYDCSGLFAHRLLRREGDDLLFAHALIRDGIYASLLRARRRDIHLRAADYFATRDSILRAEHLEGAEDPKAAEAYLAAAREEAAQIHYDNAGRLAQRGLALAAADETYPHLLLLGEVQRAQGANEDSLATYERAREAAGDAEQRCRALVGIAESQRILERYEALSETLEEAETLAGDAADRPALARILQLKSGAFFVQGMIESCLAEGRKSLELASSLDMPEMEAQSLSALGDAEFARGHMISAHGYFDRCVDLSREHGFNRVVAANLPMRGQTQLYRLRLDEAMADCLAARELAQRIQQYRAEMVAALVAAYVTEPSDPKACESWSRKTIELAVRIGATRFEQTGVEYLARSLFRLGRREEALALITKAIAIQRQSEAGMRFMGPRALGCLALVEPDRAKRLAALAQGEAFLRQGTGAHNPLWFYCDAMEVALELADWGEVRRYAAALEATTAAEPLPWSAFYAARGRALAACRSGDRSGTERDTLQELRRQGHEYGLRVALPAIEQALAGS